MFMLRTRRGMPFQVFSELEAIPGLVHAFTTRQSDALEEDADSPSQVAAEKRVLWKALNISRPRQLSQVHSDRIHRVRDCSGEMEGDGLIVEAGEMAAVRTADCLAVLLVAPQARACAVLHAGWKGTLAGIVLQGAERLKQVTGTDPAQWTAAMGPAIRECCYEVGEEVRDAYVRQGHAVERIFRDRHLDLIECNRLQLEEAGVGTILDSGQCTACNPQLYYSWRRNRDQGRMMALAGFPDA